MSTLANSVDQGFFIAILGRGPRVFEIGRISEVNP